MPLAQPVFEPPALTGWYIGLVVGFLVVVVIVIAAAIILTMAARIAAQARDGIEALEVARQRTLGLWRFADATRELQEIRDHAESARVEMESGR